MAELTFRIDQLQDSLEEQGTSTSTQVSGRCLNCKDTRDMFAVYKLNLFYIQTIVETCLQPKRYEYFMVC